MCSILGIFGLQPGDDPVSLRREALSRSQLLRHRGPDWSGVYADASAILVHERLAIVDPEGGSQPLRSADCKCPDTTGETTTTLVAVGSRFFCAPRSSS